MTAIVDIIGREILDSRGNPTVEVDVVLEDGSLGRAAVPSGASTGAHEAVELRDGDKRYLGKGVRKAVDAVNGEIFDAVGGMDAEAQAKIDETLIALDGTPNKGRLGANAILGVSLAVAKAAAARQRRAALPLCRRHLGAAPAGADDEHRQRRRACRQSDRLPGIHDHAGRRASTSPRRCAWASEIFHTLRAALKQAGHNTNVGDEGGFAPNLPSADAALDFVMQAIEKAGYAAGQGRHAGARLRRHRILQGRRLSSTKARARPARDRSRRTISPSWSRAIRSSRSRTAWRRTIGRAGRC